MELSNLNIKNGLCISIGANIDSKFGKPIESLVRCRSEVEDIIRNLITDSNPVRDRDPLKYTKFCWSSIYISSPHGISETQPNYLNTLLLVKSHYLQEPCFKKAKFLLWKFKELEKKYGRDISKDNKKWLSRCLDLDIIWWENLIIKDSEITLPHPRFINRNFVITPLAELLSRVQRVDKLIERRWEI